MTSRLAADMREFIHQVQSACDYVKGVAAWLSAQTPPRHADTEKKLRARIRETVAFADSVSEAQYDGAADRKSLGKARLSAARITYCRSRSRTSIFT
jgi:uncharacterized protein